MFYIVGVYILTVIFFPKGRKGDVINENWIQKERETAQKERERQEEGKNAQVFKLLAFILIHTLRNLFKRCMKNKKACELGLKILADMKY